VIDYSKGKRLFIENVDHGINILGVKASAMPWCFWIMIFLMPFNPLIAIPATICFALVCRLFYLAEKRGEPYEFHPKFHKYYRKFPFLDLIFPGLEILRKTKGAYRD